MSDSQESWMEVFRAGTHTSMQGVTKKWTEDDLDFAVASYRPDQHEAPLVIGHPKDNDPAYGWVEEVKREGDRLLVKPKQLDPAFREMVKAGRFKKRSISFYADGTIRHIGFLGAQPPAVKGLKDCQFAQGGDAVTVEWMAPGRLARTMGGLLGGLRGLVEQFQEGGDGEPGTEDAPAPAEEAPIQAEIDRSEALGMLDRIQWIASSKVYEITNDEEMAPDEKKAQLQALFDELRGLIDECSASLIATFAERSEPMADPKVGAIQMTPDELKRHTQDAVTQALASFAEAQKTEVQTQVQAGVKAGLADLTVRARRGEVQAFCERLRERGLKPALISDTGMASFLEGLDTAGAQTFAEAAGQQTQAQWFEAFMGKMLDAQKDGSLIVNFTETTKGRPVREGDAKARAAADYAENQETYDKMGITVEDLERTIKALAA